MVSPLNIRVGKDLDTKIVRAFSHGDIIETAEEELVQSGQLRVKLADGSGWTTKLANASANNKIYLEEVPFPDQVF